MKPIDPKEKFSQISTYWHPHRIARVNDMQVLLARASGEFAWHAHEAEDELFMVLRGTLFMQFRDRTETVREGELIVVPRGVEHCPATPEGEEVEILLFEPGTTAHTGGVDHPLRQSDYPNI